MLTQVTVPYSPGYDYGKGVDLATGSPMGHVVDGAFSGVDDAMGSISSFDIRRIHTTAELEKSLSINVEASGGCGCFSASGRFDFAQSSKIQSSSLFLLISAKVTLPFHGIDEPKLSGSAAAISSNPELFQSRYGNMFVNGVGRGGMFLAVLQMDTASSEEAQAVSMELSGSYGLFSADAKMKMESMQRHFHEDVRTTVYHEGGPINLIMGDVTDPSQMYGLLQQWLNAFQTDPNANAVPYFVTLAPISIADGPIPPNAAQVRQAQDVLVECAKERSSRLDQMNLMDFITLNPGKFTFTAPTTLEMVQEAFRGFQVDIDIIAQAAAAAINDPKTACLPVDFAAKQTPARRFPQGLTPDPFPEGAKGLKSVYADKGKMMVSRDALLSEMRELEPDGPAKIGFDIGVAMPGADTLWGPGKQLFMDGLDADERVGCEDSAFFIVARNAQLGLATVGAKIAEKTSTDAFKAARTAEPPGMYTLGFDIASGLFGDARLGARGHTARGPGSLGIRAALDPRGQRGFDAAMTLYSVA
ncbi:hypothetical protein NKG95_18325 [Mesorhizobium sp. M1423]|uniref:hypothetical protein n=1 Tax=Mesorhizobium sp. M1423 TaxID=2957101 RepID=UPI003339E79F